MKICRCAKQGQRLARKDCEEIPRKSEECRDEDGENDRTESKCPATVFIGRLSQEARDGVVSLVVLHVDPVDVPEDGRMSAARKMGKCMQQPLDKVRDLPRAEREERVTYGVVELRGHQDGGSTRRSICLLTGVPALSRGETALADNESSYALNITRKYLTTPFGALHDDWSQGAEKFALEVTVPARVCGDTCN